MTIRAVIVDDEPLARRSIRRALQHDPTIEVVAECGDGEAAVRAIVDRRPDLVFLDVQMPEMTGLEVVRAVGAEAMPVTVFVTAYDEYAIHAFDANAVDYLLKPFRRERFQQALARAKDRIAGRLSIDELRTALAILTEAGARDRFADRLPVASNGRIVMISVTDIAWIEAIGNYSRIHAAGRTYDVRDTLTRLEARLDPAEFVRIHRSTIIRIARVREIQRWFKGHHVVVLDTGERLRMSRYQTNALSRLGV